MIKLTGPIELRNLSLGRLSALVQVALSKNILIYYKTLLIKNNQFNVNDEGKTKKEEKENEKKVVQLKSQIIELLSDNRKGLSLAQIPLLLKKRYREVYNIQALGFPKLKNLLTTMKEVELKKSDGNFLSAELKHAYRKSRSKNSQSNAGRGAYLGGKKFLTLKNQPFDLKLTNQYMNIVENNLNTSGPNKPQVGFKQHRTVSNLDDYISKVKALLLDILLQNMFGIEVDRLEQSLYKALGSSFDWRITKVDSFQEFLVVYLDDYLDIEVKRD